MSKDDEIKSLEEQVVELDSNPFTRKFNKKRIKRLLDKIKELKEQV